ncbi:MAG TPA: efflux RND transporter periplasmic adaptor subunit [Opitutales bacterium]|nr:efflux RND transporter periplasmic adaptor subunit [Opitutales bacterium]
MKRLTLIVILLLAAGLIWWAAAHLFVPTAPAALVARGKATYTVTGSVSVDANSLSTIVSPAGGIVQTDNYALAEGREVKAGELLARLDSGQLGFLKNEAETQLKQDQSLLAKKLPSEIQQSIAEQDLANAEPLFKHDPPFETAANYTRLQQTAEHQTALAEKERSDLAAAAQVLQIQVDDYADQLKRLDVIAPYDGFITIVYAHPGDQVDKGGPVAGLISKDLKIQAEVNQDDIAAVHEKQSAAVTFFAYPDVEFPATVRSILPSSDKETQRFTVLLDIPNPPSRLFAGLTGEVRFNCGEHENTLLIPRRALFGDNVFVVKNGRVEVRTVKTGFLTLAAAEITDGVSEGEVVLTDNLDQFRNGDRVRLANNPAAK